MHWEVPNYLEVQSVHFSNQFLNEWLQRDQLQAEVRLARSLIGERDADILQVRCINDQVKSSTLVN